MRRWFRPNPSNVEALAMGALLGGAFAFSGLSLMERFSIEGFEVNSDETIFRCGFLGAGILTESLALYAASVIRFFVAV